MCVLCSPAGQGLPVTAALAGTVLPGGGVLHQDGRGAAGTQEGRVVTLLVPLEGPLPPLPPSLWTGAQRGPLSVNKLGRHSFLRHLEYCMLSNCKW